ncbi:MAG: hypothetical protein ACI9B9_001918 [Halioglobus sp.]|jgi:hypothetical protein
MFLPNPPLERVKLSAVHKTGQGDLALNIIEIHEYHLFDTESEKVKIVFSGYDQQRGR